MDHFIATSAQVKPNHMKIGFFLMGCSIFCFTLSLLRVFFTGYHTFLFLNWNLFLAFIPWLCSSISIQLQTRKWGKFLVIPTLLVWLLFFPNAPYILTDLFHIKYNSTAAPIWFDTTLILAFAWTGLIYGISSLSNIAFIIGKYISQKWSSVIITTMLFITAFGVYLGRYLRWNSWDIVHQPSLLFSDISDRFVHPFSHPRTWGMTIMLGVLLNMMYWGVKLLKNRED